MLRKLLLVALDWTRPKDPPFSLGQASILGTLLKNNIHVIPRSWSVNSPQFSVDDVVNFSMQHADEKTDFAIGVFVWNETHTQHILNQLKKYRFPGRIIVGGPQISYVKRGVEKYYPQADVFIRGYAEGALAQLLTAPEAQMLPVITGVHYANQPDSGLSATINFENLPSPFLTGIISPQRFIRWETQRGCPFKCAFCQHRESDESQKRRNFSQARVLEEARWIARHPVIQDVAVLDPTFNSGEQYIRVLETLCDEKYTGKLALQCRIEMVKPEFLDLVERLNQTGRVVLEFGLQTIHKKEQQTIQRPNNLKKVKEVLEDVYKRNIETEISLIFGLPHQTLESFKESIHFCKALHIKTIHAFPLMLLRGTPLHESKASLQLVESSDISVPEVNRLYEGIPHVISSPSFSREDWQKMADLATDLETYNKRNKAISLYKTPVSFFSEEKTKYLVFNQDSVSLSLENVKNNQQNISRLY